LPPPEDPPATAGDGRTAGGKEGGAAGSGAAAAAVVVVVSDTLWPDVPRGCWYVHHIVYFTDRSAGKVDREGLVEVGRRPGPFGHGGAVLRLDSRSACHRLLLDPAGGGGGGGGDGCRIVMRGAGERTGWRTEQHSVQVALRAVQRDVARANDLVDVELRGMLVAWPAAAGTAGGPPPWRAAADSPNGPRDVPQRGVCPRRGLYRPHPRPLATLAGGIWRRAAESGADGQRQQRRMGRQEGGK
jgi:hypothetical protein